MALTDQHSVKEIPGNNRDQMENRENFNNLASGLM